MVAVLGLECTLDCRELIKNMYVSSLPQDVLS